MDGDWLLYIVKTNDKRFYYLSEFCNSKIETIYSNKICRRDIDKIVLPMHGIDCDGYIYGTYIKLEDFYNENHIKEIYTGYKNITLEQLCKIHHTKLYYFYNNENFISRELDIKVSVIKTFLEEKLSSLYSDIKVLVLGSEAESYWISLKLNADIYDCNTKSMHSVKTVDWTKYDAIIHYGGYPISDKYNKIVIEMNNGNNLDLYLLNRNKELYFIDLLLSQYLTKSSAKIMYDCMVTNDSI